ncbi:NACHT domain-containing protein [Nocardiopsis sp. NPDC006198]|uniref:NACHT domain-containing protein n=1 Tax=Nocardiopsis sp. NPDC006198 TaxID=3154472 RepID=UPI0033AC97F9
MATLETAVLATAKAVGTKAGRVWLTQHAAASDREKDLTELIRLTFRDGIARRKVEHQIEGIALAVMERLQPLCEQEFRGLDDGDRAAVLAEVTDALVKADLSDKEFLGADADPVSLVLRVRAQMSGRDLAFELGEAGARLFDVLLTECCDCLVRVVVALPQFGPRAAAETLSRLSGLADQVAVVLARIPPRSLDAPEGRNGDEEFGRRYADHVSRVLDQVELFGVRVRHYRPQTSLSVAYISLSVTTDGRGREGREGDRRGGHLSLTEPPWDEGEEGSAASAATVRVESALGDRQRTLVRGEAGSGKSTLLRWLAITAVREGFGSDLEAWNGCTPFLVKLRSHADGDLPRPERFLEGTADALTGLMPRGWVHRRLTSGRALLLVDGVDELSDAQRRKVPGWLRDLLTSFPGVRVVVTSRPAAASARWLAGEGFSTAHLEPMGPSDLRELIRQWYQAIEASPSLPCAAEDLPGYEAELLGRLESAPHLRTLAATPLLAAMLCALNLDHATRLPRDRMGLYAATLEMLLDRRDGERNVPSFHDVDLDYGQKLRLLQGLAWRLSVSHRSELPRPVVLREIGERLTTMPRAGDDAEAVTGYMLQRSGVLREPVDERVDFVHRTVQEYLSAKQAVYDHDIEFLVERAHQPGWRETVVMAAGHANGPQLAELLGGVLARVRDESKHARYLKLLVAACLETAPTVPAELGERIRACIDDLVPPRDMATARSLATAGEAVLEHLPLTLDGLTDAQARATVHTVALVNGPRALELLAGYRADARSVVQWELQQAWNYFDPDEYAHRVLADAPLVDGALRVFTSGQAAALRRLPWFSCLRRLAVHVGYRGDLAFLAEVPPLRELKIYTPQSLTRDLLHHHAGHLKYLYVHLLREDDAELLARLRALRSLRVLSARLTDIGFVSRLPQLHSLGLFGLAEVADLSPLVDQRELTDLRLGDCAQLTNLDSLPLTGRLRYLGLWRTGLTTGLDEVVARAPGLTSMSLSQCSWVTGLAPLSGLRLRELILDGLTSVSDLEPLGEQDELEWLELDDVIAEDFSPLRRLRNLRHLSLRRCERLTDLTPLSELRRLRALDLLDARSGLDLAPFAHRAGLTIRIRAGQDVRHREAFRGRVEEIS